MDQALATRSFTLPPSWSARFWPAWTSAREKRLSTKCKLFACHSKTWDSWSLAPCPPANDTSWSLDTITIKSSRYRKCRRRQASWGSHRSSSSLALVHLGRVYDITRMIKEATNCPSVCRRPQLVTYTTWRSKKTRLRAGSIRQGRFLRSNYVSSNAIWLRSFKI